MTISILPKAFFYKGYPLSEAGLENVEVLYPDGHREPLKGLCVYPHEDIISALNRTMIDNYPGCVITMKEKKLQAQRPV